MRPDPREFEKFKDEAVRARELDEALARLRTSLFVAALGPAAIGAAWALEALPFGRREIAWGVLATVPLAGLLFVINYFRLPAEGKVSRAALSILLLTAAAAAGTLILAGRFSIFPS
jgi:hypothetical protein